MGAIAGGCVVQIEVDQAVNWYSFSPNDVSLIAKLVLKALNSPVKAPCAPWPRQVRITNGPPSPQVLCDPGEIARIRVYLEGFFPLQLCYQFAHEWGHVLSNNWQSYNPGPFHWLEESICGALSLYALKEAKTSWRGSKSLRQLTGAIDGYMMDIEENKNPLSATQIPNWLIDNDTALRPIQNLQELNCRLSAPLFDRFCSSPIIIRSLQARNRSLCREVNLADHLCKWAEQCRSLGISDRFPQELATLFDVQMS